MFKRILLALVVFLLCNTTYVQPVNSATPGSVNVAAQANGGVATASSFFAGYSASGANNGDRRGLGWGNGGGWNDATGNAFPDWLQINFSTTQSIGEIGVFSVQDNYTAPVDPSQSMTFTLYGLTAFQAQYWTGSAWVDVPGGNISGNNLVWRRLTFAPITTNAIRVLAYGGVGGYSRIIEVEAWSSGIPNPSPATVNVAAQSKGGVATASSFFASYSASGANDSDRNGLSWGNNGGWNDATGNAFPDWLQINFNATQTISEIGVFSVQDNYTAPADPTPSMTFSLYGVTAFQAQYWTGSAWADVPGGNISGNNLVWRRITFSPISTTAIRVLVNGGVGGYSRIAEVEAWTASSPLPSTALNVADQANGGVSAASSFFLGYPATGANNGDRKGLSWGSGGGWNDATGNAFPDWLQINFSSTQMIDEVGVFSVQDNYTAPIDPTPSMTFTLYGLTDFQVQYWTGSGWQDVPGGNITGNNRVWRRLTFTPVSTNAVRVLVNSGAGGYSRIVEVEAWTTTNGAPPPAALAPPPPIVSLQTVATSLTSPVGIENAGDGSGHLFVVQQGGQIRVLSSGTLLPIPFLDIASLIVAGGEQGLLGIAFHPNYASNGFFYVNYTRRTDGATVIARYRRSANDPNLADMASGLPLLTVPQPFTNHKGGQLRFGPDGYLYIALGDGGSSNDPGNRAQDLSTFLGKMLRIDVNNGSPYAVPGTNPFVNDGDPKTLAEIWAYGLRNPWRFSFDRLTGDLFIADVGQGGWEEINFQGNGTGAGANYGWRVMEGAHCTGLGGGPACFDGSLSLPILEYGHCFGLLGHWRSSISRRPPTDEGLLLYGDFCSGRIWGALSVSDGSWSTFELRSAGVNISSFGEDEAGELYLAVYDTGAIYRLAAQ